MTDDSYPGAEALYPMTDTDPLEEAGDAAALRAAFVAGYKQAERDLADPVVFVGPWMTRRGLYPEDRAQEYVRDVGATPDPPSLL